jgi:hypothetical protein
MPLHNHFPQKLGLCENKNEMPILQCHGDLDSIVSFEWGQITAHHMQQIGFKNVIFKKYNDLGHSYDDKVNILISEKYRVSIVQTKND